MATAIKEITEKFKGLTISDAREAMHSMKIALYEIEKTKKNEHRKATLDKALGSKNVKTIRTLLEETGSAVEKIEKNTVTITYNIPITFTFGWEAPRDIKKFAFNQYNDEDFDIANVFSTSESEVKIGKGDLNPVQRKVLQEYVNDNFDLCGESLVLFPEQYALAKTVVKNMNKAHDLISELEDEVGSEFSLEVGDIFPE